MTSAQRDLLPLDETPVAMEADAASFALKEQVAQRLAAHRARRNQPLSAAVTPIASSGTNAAPAKARSSRIAAAVAERYANSQSYRAFLAAEAEKAIRAAEEASREAEAAARVAAVSAQAVAEAQHELLEELDQWSLTPPLAPAEIAAQPEAVEGQTAPAFTVRMFEEVAVPQPALRHLRSRAPEVEADEAEDDALDEEIAFRQAPVFDDFGGAVEIPANLIEFPRQLVAARRARPRLAEGPLREDASRSPDAAQLRIFEVEAAQISTAPGAGDGSEGGGSVEPEWSSILLAAHPVFAQEVSAEASLNPVFSPQFAPQTAPFQLRLMAAMVDGCIVAAGFLGFVAAFALSAEKFSARLYGDVPAAIGHPAMETAAIGAVVTLMVLALAYQLLFFTFSEATPGMRYARIGLCSFSDDNPSRRAMRRRILAGVLAACPLGIGFLWAWLDEEGLGWHDRISRMYQRSY